MTEAIVGVISIVGQSYWRPFSRENAIESDVNWYHAAEIRGPGMHFSCHQLLSVSAVFSWKQTDTMKGIKCFLVVYMKQNNMDYSHLHVTSASSLLQWMVSGRQAGRKASHPLFWYDCDGNS